MRHVFSTWVEIIGLTAVVLSLVLVGWELNQANSLARANVYSDINQQLNQGNLLQASSPEYAELWAKLADEQAQLSDLDVQRAIGLAYWARNIWLTSERAYREGWIDQNKYQAQLNDIDVTVSMWPGIRPYLRRIVQAYEPGRELLEVERRVLDVTSP